MSTTIREGAIEESYAQPTVSCRAKTWILERVSGSVAEYELALLEIQICLFTFMRVLFVPSKVSALGERSSGGSYSTVV